MTVAKFTINRIIVFLILSNFFLEAAFGLLAPVFSVYILNDIIDGTLAVAGFAAAIYWITKSVLQLFVGRILDKIPGEIDDVAVLVLGHLIMGGSAFLYLWAETALHIYLIQFFVAVGGALAVPSWFAMFSRHVDKLNEAFEWSLNSSITTGLGVGVAGAIGGVLAEVFGFRVLFVMAGVVGITSAIALVPLYRYLKKASRHYDEMLDNVQGR